MSLITNFPQKNWPIKPLFWQRKGVVELRHTKSIKRPNKKIKKGFIKKCFLSSIEDKLQTNKKANILLLHFPMFDNRSDFKTFVKILNRISGGRSDILKRVFENGFRSFPSSDYGFNGSNCFRFFLFHQSANFSPIYRLIFIVVIWKGLNPRFNWNVKFILLKKIYYNTIIIYLCIVQL